MKVVSHNFTFLSHFPPEKYSDVKLTTSEEAQDEGKVVLVHKVVMAAVSVKMEKMFDKRCNGDVVEIRNMRFEIVQKIVRFVYTGSVEVEDGVDEDDFIDGLDMLLIKFGRKRETYPRTSTICLENPVSDFSNLEGSMNLLGSSKELDENDNDGYSRISHLSSVATPRNEFSILDDDLDLSNSSTDTTSIEFVDKHSTEAFQNNIKSVYSTSFLRQVNVPKESAGIKGASASIVEPTRKDFCCLEKDLDLSNSSTDTTKNIGQVTVTKETR
jgi:hypothetical protein